MLVTWRDEFFMKEDILSVLIGMMMCFLEELLVVDWIWGFCWFFPLTILFTWSIFLAFRMGNVSLIFKTSDVEVGDLKAWAYDLLNWELRELLPLFFLLFLGFLEWKYLEITFISFLDLAGREGGGRALLIVTGIDLGESFFELPLVGGIRGVNFNNIFDLSVLVLRSVYNTSYLDT